VHPDPACRQPAERVTVAARKKPQRKNTVGRMPDYDYKKPLNPREQRFVDCYVVDPHAIRAAEAAGFKRSYSQHLMLKPNVAAAIRRRLQDAAEKADVEAKDVILELSRLAFVNMADFLEEDEATGLPRFKKMTDLTRRQMAAVHEMTIDTEVELDDPITELAEGKEPSARRVTRIKFKLHNKRDALVDLGRYLKMFAPERDPERDNDPGAFVFTRTLSAIDRVLAEAVAAAARGNGQGFVPERPLLPVEVLPPQA